MIHGLDINEVERAELLIDINVRIDVWDVLLKKLVGVIERHNLITTAGRNLVRDLINNDAPTGLTHIAIGTGTTPAAAGDTALQTEIHRNTYTQRTESIGLLQLQYYLGTSSLNGNTLTEAGLLNAASAGTLFARVVYPGIAKTSSIALTYNWSIQINVG